MTSSGYDAITVTKKSKQYQNTISRYLEKNGVENVQIHSKKIINMFNALNGDWLLRMLSYKSHFPVEKLSILSAMKLSVKRYSLEDIIWVPISLEEILRVSGSVGLSQSGSIFSARNLGFDGKTSDDLLLVGILNGENVKVTFYPIEVKIGKVESDYLEKGIKQALRTRQIFDEIIQEGPCRGKNIKTRLYRNFFMQQVLVNAEKMMLYEVGEDMSGWELVVRSDLRRKLLNEEYEVKLLHDEKCQIAKNVPYRLLSSFMKELGGNDPLWDQRKKLVAYIKIINESRCMPYTIGTERGLNRKIIIEERWKNFFVDNMVSIRGWIQMKKVRYLQDKNPDVPGIIYKLEPENEKHRKLQNVRKLWSAIWHISGIKDIYSGTQLGKKEYEIDHFIPWSFVTNDEMWNLMPVNSSLNSSKKNKLPDWNRYFKRFAENQFLLNNMVYEYEELALLFRKCKRDNLNSLWSVDELYIKEIKKDEFFYVLEGRLKPIYESARTQGYGIWRAGSNSQL